MIKRRVQIANRKRTWGAKVKKHGWQSAAPKDVFAIGVADNTFPSYPGNSFKSVDVPGYTIKVLDGDVFNGAMKSSEGTFKRAAATVRERYGKFAD